MNSLFSKRLKELRVKKGLFQQDIADELKITSVAYGGYERGEYEPSLENLLKLCKILDTTPNYLTGHE
ncbi:MAG: helix-turn-helix domain-containing protein [Firmicutes bacterium]|nr:helix-turn-helix domain-containing protein [Bacillota bacterium]